MSDQKIEPALSAELWAAWKAATDHAEEHGASVSRGTMYKIRDITDETPAGLRRAMAFANDALPDTDPRKITREKIEVLRALRDGCANFVPGPINDAERAQDRHDYGIADSFLAALESYLPPEA